MANLHLEKVKKSFGTFDVIKGVDLEIDDGEFVVFVGPSGCGKSTLLRLVAGLEDITSGTMNIGGVDVTQTEPAERGIAMVFQSYALYPHMSVGDNMGFGLKMNGFSKEEINSRVNKAAAILHLDKLLDRKPKALSGGQRQRVAIGRSIVREPKVFLFDEPLSNLDAELRVQMRLEISKLHKDLGSTMIYVTHGQVEAMTLADKIVVLRDGIIEQVGSPLGLYHDPDNVFVAGFIGSPRMNFLDAKAESSHEDVLTVTLNGYNDTKVSVNLNEPHPAIGTDLLLGARPEHFSQQGAVRIETRIDVIENLGGSSFAYAGSQTNVPLTIQLPSDHNAREGEMYKAGIDPTTVFLFDKHSEMRLR